MTHLINGINQENGSNYKLNFLKQNAENELLKRLLAMTLDKVRYTYGITMKNVTYTPANQHDGSFELAHALDVLENEFCTRNTTGNAAIEMLTNTLEKLTHEDALIIERVLDRDLKINVGRSGVNKVWKDLVVKPPYMRCDTYTVDKIVDGKMKKGTFRNINFPAYIQLKADGMFQAVTVEQGKVTFMSRSGEERQLPHLEEVFINLPDGVYVGELLVDGMTNRAESNGLINSDDDKSKVFIQLWDYVELREYADGKHKDKSIKRTPYEHRFDRLTDIISAHVGTAQQIRLIPSYVVNSIPEALSKVNVWMTAGFEGGILKDFNNEFKDTTSKTQLKLKLVIDAEVRVTGFVEGKPGSKRVETFGSMMFETDDGHVKGSTSGFSDKQLKEINDNREFWIGKLITVEFNDITKGRDNDYYALSHPRFIEMRTDKDETDTLQRIFDMRDMAMEMKEKQ